MSNEKRPVIVCDACKYGFVQEEAPIQEQAIYVDNRRLVVRYFVCPRCRKVYKVAVLDEWCIEQLKRIAKTGLMVNKYQKTRPNMAAYWRGRMNSMRQFVQERARKLEALIPGSLSVTDDGELIYHH